MLRCIVITGGPGSGKTTLIDALAAGGLSTMPEAGRAIIRQQQAIEGQALPWVDPAAYAAQMLGWELRSFQEAELCSGPVFFDRGIPDIIGYLRLIGLPVPDHLMRAARLHRYQEPVFLAPFWPEIYGKDLERRQGLAEAEATGLEMARIYAELGYATVILPRAPVEERVAFLLQEEKPRRVK